MNREFVQAVIDAGESGVQGVDADMQCTLNAALASVDHGLDEFTIHDLRRTMRTHLSSLGVRSEVAERCLNHKPPGIEAVYNTHDYFAERRAALETWTALLLAIERGERKVTPMRQRRATS